MIVLWVLAAIGLVPFLFAARAYLLERREGLRRSSARFAASAVVVAALAVLAVIAKQPAARAVEPVAQPPKPTRVAEPDSPQIAEIRARIAKLESELEHERAELARLSPVPEPVTPRVVSQPVPSGPAMWPIYVALGLVLAGFAVLLLGDPSTLLPRRRKAVQAPPTEAQAAEEKTVAAMIAHANRARWKDALALAKRIGVEQLAKLEVLDFLYLRALCNVMVVRTEAPAHQERSERLAEANEDLARLRELAPHMPEAIYLHGYVKACIGDWSQGLAWIRDARPQLGDLRNFDHDESVCLLSIAEKELAEANNDAAAKLFDEVTRLGVLSREVPVAMVTHRILSVRGQIKAGKLAEAQASIARIREIEGLGETARRAAATACDVYEIAIRYRSGKLDEALEMCVAFLERWRPEKLPPVEDQVADEYLLPAVDVKTLALSAELYRALYFFEATLRLERAARRGRVLDAEDVDAVATALLRALQFQARHRESLAALAALYLAYRKERSEQAIKWLEAAIELGVRSPKARTLLLEARRAENERKELLAMFRAASSRFLSDPSVSAQVRNALIEELGRFDEFRPVVLDLKESGALDVPGGGELTIAGLRDRAAFVAGVAAEASARGDAAATTLAGLHRELAALTANVDTSHTRIVAIERAVMEQLGQLLLR